MLPLLFPLLLAGQSTDTAASEHFRKAGEYVQAGRLKQAAEQYKAGLQFAPDSSGAHNNLGAVYLELGSYDAALHEFQIAVSEKPEDAGYRFNRGFALFHLDRCPDALPDLLFAAGSSSHAANAYYVAGLCAYHLNRWSEATDYLNHSKRVGNTSPEALYVLIRAAKQAGQSGLAMNAFAELASHYPDSVFVHELLAEAYDLTQDSAQAEREFLQAIQISPNEPNLNFDLGYLYCKSHRFQDAAFRFKREIAINPHSAASFYYLGDIAIKEGRARDALAFFEQALHADGEYREAWAGIGEANEALGNLAAAESSFRKSIEYFPDLVESHYRLAQLLKKRGQTEKAEQQFQIVKQLQEQQRARVAEVLAQSRR